MRDELFDTHGAPPADTAYRLSNRIGQLQAVSAYPYFINVSGLEMPTATAFTKTLRDCVINSVKKGYSVSGVSQPAALDLRRRLDPSVEIRGGYEWTEETGHRPPPGPDYVGSFFPHVRGFGRGHDADARGHARVQARGRGRITGILLQDCLQHWRWWKWPLMAARMRDIP